MKKKNIEHNCYFITVSPKSGTSSKEEMTELALELAKNKDIKNYAYVVETGKDGSHEHLHILIEFTKNKRKDTYTLSVKRLVEKKKIIAMIVIKPAYNPLYLLETYLNKEDDMTNVGFDLPSLRLEVKSHNWQHNRNTKKMLHITKDSFLPIYNEVLPKLKTVFSLAGLDEHLQELNAYFYANNYTVSFMADNKRRIADLLRIRYNLRVDYLNP